MHWVLPERKDPAVSFQWNLQPGPLVASIEYVSSTILNDIHAIQTPGIDLYRRSIGKRSLPGVSNGGRRRLWEMSSRGREDSW